LFLFVHVESSGFTCLLISVKPVTPNRLFIIMGGQFCESCVFHVFFTYVLVCLVIHFELIQYGRNVCLCMFRVLMVIWVMGEFGSIWSVFGLFPGLYLMLFELSKVSPVL
jgi:hypothetical protein